MKLRSIEISCNPSYASTNANRWTAKVQYESNHGNLEIPLQPEIAEPLLAHIAPLLIEFSRRATEEIGKELIESSQIVKAIEAPQAEEKNPLP